MTKNSTMQKNFDIARYLSLEGYSESRVGRRKGFGGTQEFFTPYETVKRMCEKVPETDWMDPEKTFLEPAFGNGQFVLYMIWMRITHGVYWKTALNTLYGVELMEDNVAECKERVHEMLESVCPDYDREVATDIMDRNLVCHDFFTWDFDNWREKD